MSKVRVRDVAPNDETVWRNLWHQYVTFYEAEVSEEVTAHTWRRILAKRENMIGRVAELNGAVVGFSVSIVHAGSWSKAPRCYLEDLFVDPLVRGTGAGRALIEDLIKMGRNQGWGDLYWHTRQSNAVARRLYDRFVPADDFVRYKISMD